MAHLALYRKYRCATFADILGQEHVTRTLSNAVVEDRVAHAYLFTGPRGTGKTSTARVLAKALNCERGPTPDPCGVCEACRAITEGSSMDVIEIDAASHSKVDETREVLAGVPLAAASGRKKVYVIDEVHMLSTPAFNALLKTLEEPPEHVVFVLATTEAHKVLPTIVSRTQRFDFRRIPAKILHDHLVKVAKAESIDIEDGAVDIIARHAEGGARDALSALDQLSSTGQKVTAAEAETMFGDADGDMFSELFDAVATGDVGSVFWSIHTLMSRGGDARQLALGALSHTRSLLLLKTAPGAEDLLDAPVEERQSMLTQADRFSGASLLRIMQLLGHSYAEMRNSSSHRLLLELALVRAASPETDPDATGMLARLERLERRLGIEESHEPGPPAAPADVRSRRMEPQDAASTETVSPSEAPALEPAPSEPSLKEPARSEPSPEVGHVNVTTQDAAAPNKDATTTPKVAADASGVGFGAIKESWQATLREVNRRSKRVWGLLSPSRPAALEDSVLMVEVQSEWHRDEMGRAGRQDKTSNAGILSEALFSALGIRPDLKFQARTSVQDDAHETPAKQRSAVAQRAAPDSEEVPDIHETTEMDDPVDLIKKGFGAEVVEERTSGSGRGS
jgi:DNA polymerase-3 subunit gamma/tau